VAGAVRILRADAARTWDLRRRVLRSFLPADAPPPADEHAGVIHLAAVGGQDELLGTCRTFAASCDWRPESPAWMLRSMAVEPAAQGLGIGQALVAAAITEATAAGAAILWCHARETAAGFWIRAGFQSRFTDGDARQVYVDLETSLPHRDMWAPLRPR
jgi:GNAT superfamily N-acetyltransferase